MARITVTGATGNVGRILVQLLAEAGEEVTAVARGGGAAADEFPESVRVAQGDLEAPDSLAPALAGADALFLLGIGEDPAGIVEAVRAAGVARVVLVSSQGAGTRPDAYRGHRAFEDALRAADLEWTILRLSGLFSNTFAWIEGVRAQRTVASPFGDIGLPWVDPADVAAVAAAALRGDGHGGRTYELTGPAATTPRERAAALAHALGSALGFHELTREEARAFMLQRMPAPIVEATLAVLGDPLPEEQRVSPDVERVLGRAPASFADWAARNTAVFAGSGPLAPAVAG